MWANIWLGFIILLVIPFCAYCAYWHHKTELELRKLLELEARKAESARKWKK